MLLHEGTSGRSYKIRVVLLVLARFKFSKLFQHALVINADLQGVLMLLKILGAT